MNDLHDEQNPRFDTPSELSSGAYMLHLIKGKVPVFYVSHRLETTEQISTIFGTNVCWVHETVYQEFYQNPYELFRAIGIFTLRSSFGQKSCDAKSKQYIFI